MVEVDCKALFVPVLTEAPEDVPVCVGLAWDGVLERYTAPLDGAIDGVAFRGPSGMALPVRPVW